MAVYTHITHDDLAQHLSAFDIGALQSFSGITDGVENSNFKFTTGRATYILTLFEKRVSVDELPYYLGFMEYLREHGVPSPFVVESKDGKRIVPLNGKPAVITEFLQGAWLRVTTPEHTAQMGKLLAKMHDAGRHFTLKRNNTMSFPAWKSLIHASFDKADTVEKGLYEMLDRELDYLEKNWPKFLPKGGIHADLFPDNVFFEDGQLSGVIDFYFSCWDILAYDLMLTFNAWCFDGKGNIDTGKAGHLLSQYHAKRPLSPEELKALPFFGRAAAVRIIATRLYDWLNPVAGAQVTRKDPREHIAILKFHQNVRSLVDYGFRT